MPNCVLTLSPLKMDLLSFENYSIETWTKFMISIPKKRLTKSSKLTISEDKSARSLAFLFRQRSTKSRIFSENTFAGSFGGGWLTMYSSSSKIAMGLGWGRAAAGTTAPRAWARAPVVAFCIIWLSLSAAWGPKIWFKVSGSGGGIG